MMEGQEQSVVRWCVERIQRQLWLEMITAKYAYYGDVHRKNNSLHADLQVESIVVNVHSRVTVSELLPDPTPLVTLPFGTLGLIVAEQL